MRKIHKERGKNSIGKKKNQTFTWSEEGATDEGPSWSRPMFFGSFKVVCIEHVSRIMRKIHKERGKNSIGGRLQSNIYLVGRGCP
jgi:hypothetical protein